MSDKVYCDNCVYYFQETNYYPEEEFGTYIKEYCEVSKTIDRKHLSPVTVKIGLIPSMANKLNNCKYYKGITK